MRYAMSNQPFNFIQDKWYQIGVGVLRPGTHIPDPTTTSNDIELFNMELLKQVCDYIKQLSFYSIINVLLSDL